MAIELLVEKCEQERIFKEKTGYDFSFFYKKYYPKLVYFTNRMCDNPQEAEDVSTDSFMIALDKIERYERERGGFSTWLFTIAKNLMIQRIKEANKKTSIDIEIDEEGTTLKDFIEDKEDNNLDIQAMYEMKATIMLRCIDKLSDPYKKVITMREIQKMPYRKIADELNLNENTVKSQIRNGRIILQKMVRKDYDMIDQMFL